MLTKISIRQMQHGEEEASMFFPIFADKRLTTGELKTILDFEQIINGKTMGRVHIAVEELDKP